MKRFPIALSAVLVALAAGCGEVPTAPAPLAAPSLDGIQLPPPGVDDGEGIEESSGALAVSGG